MLFAGGVTVGDASMTALFHILDQPELYQRLRSEIRTAWPDINRPPSLEALEALPVLTATIKETLRFTPGACASLLRIVPNSGAVISGVSVPGGTIVGMASTFVHRSDVIFEDPDSFKPERWLGEGAKGLEKNLVAFSRGKSYFHPKIGFLLADASCLTRAKKLSGYEFSILRVVLPLFNDV